MNLKSSRASCIEPIATFRTETRRLEVYLTTKSLRRPPTESWGQRVAAVMRAMMQRCVPAVGAGLAGDALCLFAADAGQLRPGALVAFRSDGALVVHRVLSRTPDGLVTKGDTLPDADPPVLGPAVAARVAAVRTPAGRRLDLDRWPWPAVGRLLTALARRSVSNRLAWIARRAPFHLIARFCR